MFSQVGVGRCGEEMLPAARLPDPERACGQRLGLWPHLLSLALCGGGLLITQAIFRPVDEGEVTGGGGSCVGRDVAVRPSAKL